jgi:hypothetical protein
LELIGIEKYKNYLGRKIMENSMNVSSEEELAQLRNEGKISEAEYQDLLAAMRMPSPNRSKDDVPETDKAKSKRKISKIAFALMLIGIFLPTLCYLALVTIQQIFVSPHLPERASAHVGYAIWFFLGLALEIAAFTLGIKSWQNDYGKAATIISGIILVLSILVIS